MLFFFSTFFFYNRCIIFQISVSVPFWLVNKSGIPLVFKRQEDDNDVAGQFEEHERARSLTPLPFSFVSSEYMFTCQMRVGKHYQLSGAASGGLVSPAWCRPFNFELEFEQRTLYARCATGGTSGGGLNLTIFVFLFITGYPVLWILVKLSYEIWWAFPIRIKLFFYNYKLIMNIMFITICTSNKTVLRVDLGLMRIKFWNEYTRLLQQQKR